MKFKLVEKHRYWWPVVVRIPNPEVPGKMIEQKLKILFEPQDRDAAVAATEAYEKLVGARARADHEHQQLLEVSKDWDDVEDDDRQAVPFSEDNFRAALQKGWFRSAVYSAYSDSISGNEARVGN